MIEKKFLISAIIQSETEIETIRDMNSWIKIKNEHGCKINDSELKFEILPNETTLLVEKAFDLAFELPGNAELLEVIRKIQNLIDGKKI